MYAQKLQYEHEKTIIIMTMLHSAMVLLFQNLLNILFVGFVQSMKRTMEEQLISHQSPCFGHRFQHQWEFRFLRFCEDKNKCRKHLTLCDQHPSEMKILPLSVSWMSPMVFFIASLWYRRWLNLSWRNCCSLTMSDMYWVALKLISCENFEVAFGSQHPSNSYTIVWQPFSVWYLYWNFISLNYSQTSTHVYIQTGQNLIKWHRDYRGSKVQREFGHSDTQNSR